MEIPQVAVILHPQGQVPAVVVILRLQGHQEVLLHSVEVQEVVVAAAKVAEAEVQDQVVVVQELLRSVNFLFLF